MSNPAPVVILAEDQRQVRLVRTYLRTRHPSFNQKQIFNAPMANGQGSGAQWVINQYETQLRAHLIRRAKLPDERRPEKWLIIVIDADNNNVQDRLNEFRKRIAESRDERVRRCRAENENIAQLVPKWSVETWILNLNGETVDENMRYKLQNRAWDDLTKSAGSELNGWVRSKDDSPIHCTPSLREALHKSASRVILG